MIRTAMIMAAGLGTRMRPLTEHTPKPLLQVAGRSLLDHTLDRLAECGIQRAVVNIHAFPDQMRAALTARTDIDIRISDETAQLLETGGGIRKALPLLGDDPALIVNADNIWLGTDPFRPLLEDWDPARMDALLLLVRRERAMAYSRGGDFYISGHGRLIRRGELEHAPYVFSGAQVIKPTLFAHEPLEPFSTNRIWDRVLERGRGYGTFHSAGWVDVGTPGGLEAAATALVQATRRAGHE